MDQQLPPLHEALAQTTWRRLAGIFDRLGLPLRRGQRKADAVAALADELNTAVGITTMIAQLDSEAQAALAALVAANGQLPVVTFAQRFGAVRPPDTTAKPWLAPISATEQLWWIGFLYLHPPRRKPGVIQAYALPAELLPLVSQALPATREEGALDPWQRPGRPADFWWHSTLWLATIAGAAVRVTHGRWLPPTLLNTLAARMGLDQEADYRASRSERQLPYLAFLHYLAEIAALVQGEQLLQATPNGWQWLAADDATRRQLLWQQWCAAPADQAFPYRFAWEPCSPQAKALLCTELRRLSSTHFVPLHEVIAALHLKDNWGLLPGSPLWTPDGERSAEPLAALLCGPLFWLGLIDVAERASVGVHPTATTLFVRLTAWGRWLLGTGEAPPPSTLPATPCTIRRRAPNTLVATIHTAPEQLARLAIFCDWAPQPSARWEQQLTLTPEGWEPLPLTACRWPPSSRRWRPP